MKQFNYSGVYEDLYTCYGVGIINSLLKNEVSSVHPDFNRYTSLLNDKSLCFDQTN